jgi:outer membrane protein OmpA-like peptidoglycan-associated protein
MAGISGPTGATGAAGAQGNVGPTGAQGPMVASSGWNSYRDYTFKSDNDNIISGDRNKAREIAAYMNNNPSARIALDGSNAQRVNIVRGALLNAGVPASRIQTGAYGNPQYRRNSRVAVLVSN